MSAGARFRKAVEAEHPLQIAGTINAYSALLAERAGFRAIYLSGAGVANASFGLPDLAMTTLVDVCEDIRRISYATELPLLVDADTGWGGAFMISRTVREMTRAGAAGAATTESKPSPMDLSDSAPAVAAADAPPPSADGLGTPSSEVKREFMDTHGACAQNAAGAGASASPLEGAGEAGWHPRRGKRQAGESGFSREGAGRRHRARAGSRSPAGRGRSAAGARAAVLGRIESLGSGPRR